MESLEALTERKLFEDSPYVTGCEMEYDEYGNSYSGGQSIVKVPLDTPRTERIAVRIDSSDVLGQCVQYGYLIGRDDVTKEKSNRRLLEFLGATL